MFAEISPRPGALDPAYIPIFLLGFIVLWWLVLNLIAVLGGWRRLAENYRLEGPFEGRKWHFRSARFRYSTNYGAVLTYGANHAGLYLAVLLPFRPGHPPLLIPWKDVRKMAPRWYEFFGTPLLLGADAPIRILASGHIVREIEYEIGRELPTAPET